jgi:hypothetical protein
MSVTLPSPTAYNETQSSNSGIPAAWILASNRLLRKLIDSFDASASGLFDADVIDFAGQKTDSARWGEVSGVGFEQAMASAGSEVSAITGSTQTTAYGSVSVAEYVIGYTETFRNQILMGPNGSGVNLSLDDLTSLVPASYEKTLRGLLTASGATISANVIGATTTALSADDLYDLRAAHTSKYGAGELGAPILVLRAQQHNEVIESFRSENYLWGTDLAQRMQRVTVGQRLSDPYGLGFDVQLTDDVVSASSVLKGFCTSPGAWKRAIASPEAARIPAGARRMIIPGYGLLIWEKLSGSDLRTSGFNAYANMGVGLKSSNVSFQALVRSKA